MVRAEAKKAEEEKKAVEKATFDAEAEVDMLEEELNSKEEEMNQLWKDAMLKVGEKQMPHSCEQAFRWT